jgi:hypothetical protein
LPHPGSPVKLISVGTALFSSSVWNITALFNQCIKNRETLYLQMVNLIDICILLKVVTNAYVIAILRSLHPKSKCLLGHGMIKKGAAVVTAYETDTPYH